MALWVVPSDGCVIALLCFGYPYNPVMAASGDCSYIDSTANLPIKATQARGLYKCFHEANKKVTRFPAVQFSSDYFSFILPNPGPYFVMP